MLLRVPDLVVPALQLRLHNQQNSALSPKLTEMAILIAARHLTNSYEWNAHYTLAVKAGLSTDVIAAIADGRRPERMAEDEAILHDFCIELLQNKSVSDANLRAGTGQIRRGGCRRGCRPRGLLHVPRHGHERGAVAVARECDTEARAVSEIVEVEGASMTTRWTASSCAVAAFAVGCLFAGSQSTVEGQSGSKSGFGAVSSAVGAMDVTGPYDVVEGWPKDISTLPGNEKWTWGAGQGVFAESPNRVLFIQRGQLPVLPQIRATRLSEIAPSLTYPVMGLLRNATRRQPPGCARGQRKGR